MSDITVTTFKDYTTIHQPIELLGGGVGTTACWECEGTGDWSRFHPDSENLPYLPCVDCKGTGRRYIMAY